MPPGSNSDILLTPDFRILIGGPGAADVKVRLGEHGDTAWIMRGLTRRTCWFQASLRAELTACSRGSG